MKILFVSCSGLKFDLDTPRKEPLGGTESAICYLIQALQKRGHEVNLCLGNPEGYETPDIVVIASAPFYAPVIRQIFPVSRIILWNHMRPDQGAIKPLFDWNIRKTIDCLVYVSSSQRVSFMEGARDDLDGEVINNAICPDFENMFKSPKELLAAKECLGAYTSTPFRGLELLADLKEIPIDVYSSMAVYQGDDKPFNRIYDKLSHNGAITLHGSLSQFKLARQLKHCAFLVYPCTFKECHSIAIIEAQAAGMKILTTPLAHERDQFVDICSGDVNWFRQLLINAIHSFRNYPEEWAARMFEQVQHINQNYTWEKKAKQWEELLQLITERKAA